MIGVIGAGAFGTALAVSLARDGRAVTLWARDANHAAAMAEARENAARLPGIAFPQSLCVTASITDLAPAQTVLLVTPMQTLAQVLGAFATTLAGKTLVACCKGIDLSTGRGPSAIIADLIPSATPALLSGPSFAVDIAAGLPTALTLATRDAAMGEALQRQLSTANLRLYRSTDLVGVEIGGALKNVVAIACGACIGQGMGESARAAVMTRGFAEMQRLAAHLGAAPQTLAGLSGLGDLALTCASDLSRNYRFGLALGRKEAFATSVTVEGAATAKALVLLAERLAIELPISVAVAHLCEGTYSVAEAIEDLLSRPLRAE